MHHPMRRELGILAMGNDRQSEHTGIFQSAAHQLAIHH
jgi:hypothetical protein